jgi:molecular chaperone GrpE
MNEQERVTLAEESQKEIRVTDRRRVYLDDAGAEKTARDLPQPNLKPTYVEELEARTKAAERQVQEVQSRFEQLRKQLQQETDETRVRLNRAADERAAAATAKIITSLLPVMDDLERAIQAANEGADQAHLLEGLRGISALFKNALSNAGVEAITSVGDSFDPQLHEAVDTAEAEDNLEGKVIEEYARGFKIGDRLLRPARVKVGRARQSKTASE